MISGTRGIGRAPCREFDYFRVISRGAFRLLRDHSSSSGRIPPKDLSETRGPSFSSTIQDETNIHGRSKFDKAGNLFFRARATGGSLPPRRDAYLFSLVLLSLRSSSHPLAFFLSTFFRFSTRSIFLIFGEVGRFSLPSLLFH